LKLKFKQNDFDFLSEVLKVCPTCKQEIRHETQMDDRRRHLEDVRTVIKGWKVQTGVAEDDKAWDREHFKEHIKAAESLLTLFGNDVNAGLDCIEDTWGRLVSKQGLSLSLWGVKKNSDVFRQKWLERKARKEGAMD
jgi:hypothetical protein